MARRSVTRPNITEALNCPKARGRSTPAKIAPSYAIASVHTFQEAPANMNPSEALFELFLEQNNIKSLHGKGGPPLKNPETGNAHYPDFFIPKTQLYIEVKGRMGMLDIRLIGKLAQQHIKYYLYQPYDWDWDTQISDWPSGSLKSSMAKHMQARAKKAELEHLRLHPSRNTSSAFRKTAHHRQFRRALQREEVLLLCDSTQAAKAASAVTLTRVRRYVDDQVLHLKRAGLVDLVAIAQVP
jgi:hypothetical protein